QVAGDVRLRIRELGRADGGELEYPHVGAGAIARGVAAWPELLVDVHSHGGTRERAHEGVAVDRAPRPSRPPDDETETVERAHHELAHRVARAHEPERRGRGRGGRRRPQVLPIAAEREVVGTAARRAVAREAGA